jgi:hypothetical protein
MCVSNEDSDGIVAERVLLGVGLMMHALATRNIAHLNPE